MSSKPQRSFEEDEYSAENSISLSLKHSESSPFTSLLLSSKAILVVTCDAAALLASKLVVDLSMEEAATIIDDNSGDIYCSVFSSSSGLTIVAQDAANQKGRKSNESSEAALGEVVCSRVLAAACSSTKKTVVILLSDIKVGQYKQSAISAAESSSSTSAVGAIRKVCSSASEALALAAPFVANIGVLESGNIVTGVSAAVLNYCEVRDIPSFCYMAVSPPTLSVETMRSFEVALPLLSAIIEGENPRSSSGVSSSSGSSCSGGDSFQFKRPSQAEYQRLVKNDPYMSRTETIYM